MTAQTLSRLGTAKLVADYHRLGELRTLTEQIESTAIRADLDRLIMHLQGEINVVLQRR